ncbi:conserved hypothetical protein [Culex quinquefasciatus]|uniref:Uncharacterized protein n=2 Tax=Culex pipiens complex TaxID=518105 RepID=B0WHJ3_CULQU|nr:conserved hypothetical protein [Culex quinquefasciatus]|eukprot:XP_001848177.1 conserved hypothetical protein [Culex quinquefasciatus]
MPAIGIVRGRRGHFLTSTQPKLIVHPHDLQQWPMLHESSHVDRRWSPHQVFSTKRGIIPVDLLTGGNASTNNNNIVFDRAYLAAAFSTVAPPQRGDIPTAAPAQDPRRLQQVSDPIALAKVTAIEDTAIKHEEWRVRGRTGQNCRSTPTPSCCHPSIRPIVNNKKQIIVNKPPTSSPTPVCDIHLKIEIAWLACMRNGKTASTGPKQRIKPECNKDGKAGAGRDKSAFIQTSGIFSEGLAKRSRYEKMNNSSREPGEAMRRPVLRSEIKVDPEEERKRICDLFGEPDEEEGLLSSEGVKKYDANMPVKLDNLDYKIKPNAAGLLKVEVKVELLKQEPELSTAR